MKGTITLKIVAEPNAETKVLIEKTEAEMNFKEVEVLYKMVSDMEETLKQLNDSSTE